MELKIFCGATSICVPLCWRLELVEGFLSSCFSGPRPEVPDPPVSLEPPVLGPPSAWVHEHGMLGVLKPSGWEESVRSSQCGMLTSIPGVAQRDHGA